MKKQNRSTKRDQNHQGNVEVPKSESEKIRYGAPDGPRPEGSENYNGHTPIEWPGLEAVAQYLAAPKPLREFKSDNDLAKHFHVTRMTIYRWKHHPDVVKRVYWIASNYRLVGDLMVRINWPQITQKVYEEAMDGNIAAAKFCEEIAWRQEKRQEKSEISPYSLEEVLERSRKQHIRNAELMTPTWVKERAKRLAANGGSNEHNPAGVPADVITVEAISVPMDPIALALAAESEVASQPTNTCDSCGKQRCAHGRCPTCDVCETCENPRLCMRAGDATTFPSGN